MSDPIGDLVAHAHGTHVVVVGGGIAGLVAALECAKVGLQVSVVEANTHLGGTIRTAELAGARVDLAVDGYSTRGGTVRALVDELGLGDAVLTAPVERAWIEGMPGREAAPVPEGVLGIPANPFAEEVRRLIGWSGAWRAYLDRLRPPLTIGHERSLGKLVRTRMGQKVLERLVEPVSFGLYGVHPDEVDADLAAPGLNAALTRVGSLSGAVAQLGDAPAARIESLAGGMTRLIDALHARLLDLGAEVRTGVPVTGLEQGEDGRWTMRTSHEGDGDAAEPELAPADLVIVATPENAARLLLEPFATIPGPAREGTALDVVTLVVESEALDAHPRGPVVYAPAGGANATSVTHVTARWPERAPGPGLHVLRVALPQNLAPDDADIAEAARLEAEARRGVPSEASQVHAWQREVEVQVPPAALIGGTERAEAVRAAVHASAGLGVVGAWLGGAGIAQVIPDAIAEAERLRRAALWGDGA